MNTHKASHSTKTLINTTALLFALCLCVQVLLAAQYAQHSMVWTNLVVHLFWTLGVVILCNFNKPNMARVSLLLCFYSYIVSATLLWQKDVYIQHFLLIGSLFCLFIFSQHERYASLFWGLLYVATFCAIDIHLSFALSGWEGAIRRGNSVTLAIASVSIIATLHYHTLKRWKNLSANYRTAREMVNKITPAAQLISKNSNIHRQNIAFACVLFADIKGYQKLASLYGEAYIIDTLDTFYCALDKQAKQFSILPVKTNGDEYMAVSALCENHSTNTQRVTNSISFALAILTTFTAFANKHKWPCQIRIGLAAGPVTAGMPKRRHGIFDIWGKTVNLAAMLEQGAGPDSIVISPHLFKQLPDNVKHQFTPVVVTTKAGKLSAFRYPVARQIKSGQTSE